MRKPISIVVNAALGALAWVAGAAAWAQAPEAQTPNTFVLQGDQGFVVALQVLARDGQYERALQLLDSRPDLADRADVKRLRAQFLFALGREREALSLLEAHLTEDRQDAIARFQLAEIYFLTKRDSAARLAYRLALAGSLDPTRAAVANARLAEIYERRRWTVWAGASIAPDSNLNGATDASRVDLFGLPFDLDERARRQSGVSFSAFGGLERRIVLEDGPAVRVGVVGSFRDAPNAELDDLFLSLRAGPEWTLSNLGSLTVQATAGKRWFGGDVYQTTLGVRTEAEFAESALTRWSLAANADDVTAELNPAQSGWSYGFEGARTHYMGPSSLWRLGGGVARLDAQEETQRFTQARVSAGRLFALPLSTLAYIEPYAAGRRYDAAAAAFGIVREDVELGLAARFSKRDFFFGAFPFLAVSVARNDSNISLYDFSRERLEIGLTREF